MTDRFAFLEADLRALGHDLDAFVAGRDVSAAVAARLADRSSGRRARRSLVLALVTVTTVVAVPPARAAVVDAVRVGVELVRREPPPPERRAAATPNLAGLGERTTLTSAQRHMPVVVPRTAMLGEPSSVWFAARGSGQTSLVYARDDVLVQEFAGNSATTVEKYVEFGTTTEAVTIDGYEAVFLHGGEHVVWYDDAGGEQVTEVGRLAGNALVMQRGALTIRIEADRDLDDLVAIARSLR